MQSLLFSLVFVVSAMASVGYPPDYSFKERDYYFMGKVIKISKKFPTNVIKLYEIVLNRSNFYR